MRSTPPFELDVRNFGVWRGAVLAVVAAAAASMLTWFLGPVPASPGVRIAALLCAGLAVGTALTVAAPRPMRLRWAGRQWWLMPLGAAPGEPAQVEVHVLIDLGVWMLLRCVPVSGGGLRRSNWLPVQRAGAEGSWHALRCAVYSPRPAPVARQGSTAAADSQPLE